MPSFLQTQTQFSSQDLNTQKGSQGTTFLYFIPTNFNGHISKAYTLAMDIFWD